MNVFERACSAIRGARELKAADVIAVLSDLFILRDVPGHVRPDNGPEFIAKSVQAWITGVGTQAAYIAPGSPWKNGTAVHLNVPMARGFSLHGSASRPSGFERFPFTPARSDRQGHRD